MGRDTKWIKSKTTKKNVPCEPERVRIIPNEFSSDIYYTSEGEQFHGITHPNGCIFAYKMKPPSFFQQRKSTRY